MKVALISPYQITDGLARYTTELVAALRAGSFDLDINVIPWNYPNRVVRLLLPIVRVAGVANRLRLADIVHIQFVASWYLGHLWLPLWLARLNNPRLKIIFTVHETNDNTAAPWFFNWLQNCYLASCDAVIVHSNYHKNLLPISFHKKTSIIPLSIPTIPESNTDEDRDMILLPGFINPWKGHDLAIHALAMLKEKFPKLYIVVLGKAHDPSYTEELRSLAKSLGLATRVIFKAQFLPDDKFARYFKEAGLILLPYRRIAMSAVLAQAIAHQKITVTSDLLPLREYTKNEAIYFKQGDPRDLAAKIEQALTDNVARGHLKNLFAKLRQEYSGKTVAMRTVELYKSIYAN